MPRQPTDQRTVCVRIRAVEVRPCLHIVEDLDGALRGFVVDARAHHASTDLCIHIRPVGVLQCGIHSLKCFVKLATLAPHLNNDRQGVVGRRHVVTLHLHEQLVCQREVAMLHAAVKQCVKNHGVGLKSTAQHLLEELQSSRQVTANTMTTDQAGVCDAIGLAPLLLHLLQELLCTLHQAILGVRIDQGGEGDVVHLDAVGFHVAVQGHCPVGVAGASEALDQGRIDDGVTSNLGLKVLEQRQSVFDLLRLHQRIDHAAQGDIVGLQSTTVHQLIPEVPATLRPVQHGTSLDQKAISADARFDLTVRVAVHGPRETIEVTAEDASIEDSVEHHLVLKDTNIGTVQDSKCLHGLPFVGQLSRQLHHDGRHIGVERDPTFVHLIEDVQGFLEIHRLGGATEQATEGGGIGSNACNLHVAKGPLGVGKVSDYAMAFDHCVVGDEIHGMGRMHLLQELEGALHLLVDHAGVERDVVGHDIDQLRLALLQLPEGRDGPVDVAFLAGRTDQPHVVLDALAIELVGKFM
mmetsp:Transcript_171053/g.548146  ORF Transcript_171053/g.548146 Transcript_171053/m.548146 type:complete len:522 (+) Transcript_171053:810-2375(+)